MLLPQAAREVAAVYQMFLNLGVKPEDLEVHITDKVVAWRSAHAPAAVLVVTRREPSWGRDQHVVEAIGKALDWWAAKATDDERWDAWSKSTVYLKRQHSVPFAIVSGMCGEELKNKAIAERQAQGANPEGSPIPLLLKLLLAVDAGKEWIAKKVGG